MKALCMIVALALSARCGAEEMTAQEYQRAAVKRYPALGVAGSR